MHEPTHRVLELCGRSHPSVHAAPSANDDTIMFAACSKCSWRDCLYFKSGGQAEGEAEAFLHEEHARITEEECDGEIVFREKKL